MYDMVISIKNKIPVAILFSPIMENVRESNIENSNG
jgi:hypothetical protein